MKNAAEDEITPLQDASRSTTTNNRRSMKKLLVRQMSSVELPVDSKTGNVKLLYVY